MSLEEINKKIPSSKGKTQILLANSAMIWADSTPAPTIDSNHRKGWYYTNTSTNDKTNIYFFDGVQETIRVQDLNSIWAKVSIDNFNSLQHLPHFVVYTKPTGDGDAGPWFHSKFTYTFDSDVIIGIGEEVIIHSLNNPNVSFDCRLISMPNVVIVGDGLPEEEILYITIHTDSGATAGEVKILFSNLGFQSRRQHIRNVELIGYVDTVTVPEYPTGNGGVLLVSTEHITTNLEQTATITNNTTFYSGSISNPYPSKGDVVLFGNSNTQNTQIRVQYSMDNITWYYASNISIMFDMGTALGNFAIDFKTQAPYIRVSQFNNSGSDQTISVRMVIR
tara:strand:+ start:12001 stop:13005 length:1005 start_codon:yes stop_codon:yes gene_type:complete